MARYIDPKLRRMRDLDRKERDGLLTDSEQTELMQLDVWWGRFGRLDCAERAPKPPALDGLRWLQEHDALRQYVKALRHFISKYRNNPDVQDDVQHCMAEMYRLKDFHRDRRWDQIPPPMPPEDATDGELREALQLNSSGAAAKECRRRLQVDDDLQAWTLAVKKYRASAVNPSDPPHTPPEGNFTAWQNHLAALKATRRYWERLRSEEPDWLSGALIDAEARVKYRGYPSPEEAMAAGAMQPRGRPRMKLIAMNKIQDLLRAHRGSDYMQDEYGHTIPPFALEGKEMWDDKNRLNGWLMQYRACEELCHAWRDWDPPEGVVKSDRRLRQLAQMREDIRARLKDLAAPKSEPTRPVELVEWKPTRAVDRNRAATDAATRQRMLLHVAQWESPAFESDGRKYMPERFLPRGIGGRAHDRIRGELAKKEMLQKRIVGLEHLAGPWWGFLQKDLDLAVMVDQDEA